MLFDKLHILAARLTFRENCVLQMCLNDLIFYSNTPILFTQLLRGKIFYYELGWVWLSHVEDFRRLTPHRRLYLSLKSLWEAVEKKRRSSLWLIYDQLQTKWIAVILQESKPQTINTHLKACWSWLLQLTHSDTVWCVWNMNIKSATHHRRQEEFLRLIIIWLFTNNMSVNTCKQLDVFALSVSLTHFSIANVDQTEEESGASNNLSA